MNEHPEDIHSRVITQGAQMQGFHNRLGHLESEFKAFSHDTGLALRGISDQLAGLSAQKPTGLMDTIQGAITLGVFVAILIGGVSYVVQGELSARLVTLELQQAMLIKNQNRRQASSWQLKSPRIN